jgi:uncharacterized membrane protein
MKTRIIVAGLIIVLLFGSIVYAFDCDHRRGWRKRFSRQALFSQLPAEKEMLFHQTMRDAREKGSELRTEIKALREDIAGILATDPFDENLFREKTSHLESLRMKRHDAMEEAIVTLAKQFTSDERKVLVQLLPGKRGYGGPMPRRGDQ